VIKNILLPLILGVLSYGFWISPNFKDIAAGIAIFLFGMLFLEEGFKKFSGGILETVLQKSTDNLYKSLSFGVITTSIMQSSSLVSVLSISFLGAGLISLTQGIGIIFGANLGTTTGAWLVAGLGLKVNIASYAMPMLVFGIVFILQKRHALKGIGYILAGLGFLFLGIHYMKEGFEAFRDTIDLASLSIEGIKGLFIFAAIGIVATVIMQSSHATLVLIITALSAQQISYENALALAIGANVGTTITAILGAMSSNVDGKRLAGAHLIFNLVTGLIALFLIHQLIISVEYIASFVGIANDDYTLKLALFHTIFNLIGIVVMIPFIDHLVRYLQTYIKEEAQGVEELKPLKASFLNESVLEFPTTAMSALYQESFALYQRIFEILSQGLGVSPKSVNSANSLDEVLQKEYSNKNFDIDTIYTLEVKGIYGEILDFATKAQGSFSEKNIEELYKLKVANRALVETIKDMKHLQKNLKRYKHHKNTYIQKEYNTIRKNIVQLLRDVNTIASTPEEETIITLLSKARIHAQQNDLLANGVLDELIRNHLISNEMATSLMNDSTYAYNICKNLITMSEILFLPKTGDSSKIENEIIVNEDDIAELLKVQKESNNGTK